MTMLTRPLPKAAKASAAGTPTRGYNPGVLFLPRGYPTAAAAVVIVLASALCCPGGTIRHDRDPGQYLGYASAPTFASAGLLRVGRPADTSSGSGVLVGDGRWVLTAAHLLESTQSLSFEVGGRSYASDGWVAHPRYDGDFRKGHDIGLVRLTERVDGVAPAGLYRGRRELGAVVTVVGFGRTGTGLSGAQPFEDVDYLGRAGTNVIDGTVDALPRTYKSKLPGRARVFVTDFDSPDDPSVNTTGSAEPTDLEILISHGDSGGPVFLDAGDGRGAVVAGIHSFGEFRDERDDSDYGDVAGHTRVATSRGWIEKMLRRGATGRGIPDFTSAAGGATAMELSAPRAAAVPEPSAGLALLLLAAPALLARRRRRRHPAMPAGAMRQVKVELSGDLA
jgi:hypothetical protein